MSFFKVALFSLLFLLATSFAIAQNGCPINGQNPLTAFPVCGSNVFSQGIVDTCSGRVFKVSQCADRIQYTDKNPYWYKFTCFKTGTLSFLITPNNPTSPDEDYDWQLFDVTKRNVEDVYTDPSLNVANNWSGNFGLTGATSAGSVLFNCGGPTYPTYSAMPTLIKGHDYLLMVSHFSDNQWGYQLSFNTGVGGGTAGITDTLTPAISRVKLKCSGDKIGIKLNKPMLCSSLATDGSGFALTNNPKIDSVVGRGCRGGFDMDSVTIYLAAPYAPGIYNLVTKADAFGKTIADICGTSIPLGDTFSFVKVIELPTLMDSITTPLPCAPTQLELVFKDPMQCSSVLADGSQFYISGPSAVTVASATTNCDTNGLATKIYVNLSAPISTDGNYKIHLTQGTNFTTLINECSVPTPLDSLPFKSINAVSANFSLNTLVGCNQDTVNAKYIGIANGSNNVIGWQWLLNDSLLSKAPDASFMYNTFNSKTLKLTVTNGVCSDSVTKIITPVDHTIKAGFISPDTICGSVQAAFQDTSVGNIVSWKWNFGDGKVDSLKSITSHTYPLRDTLQSYNTSLYVSNQVGCTDSAFHTIKVRASTPSWPAKVDSIACAATSISLVMTKSIDCNSVAPDGSNFSITGADNISVTGANVSCTNGLGAIINLSLSKLLTVNGAYKLNIVSSNGKRLKEACGIETPDTFVVFSSTHNVFATMDTATVIGCKQDSIKLFNDGNNKINSWAWTLDGVTKTSQSATFIDTSFNQKTLKLVVTNGICVDSATKIFTPLDHTIKSGFISPDTICGNVQAAFQDTSLGNIVSWKWNFGDGKVDSLQSITSHTYPVKDTLQSYNTSLYVSNQVGCADSAFHTIKVRSSTPSWPAKVDSVACAATSIKLVMTKSIDCNSVAPDGSNFSITGADNVSVTGANVSCTNGFGAIINLSLSKLLTVNGAYKLSIVSSNGKRLKEACGIETPDTFVVFSSTHNVFATMDTATVISCKQDSIKLFNDGNNKINSWAWTLDGITKTSQFATFIDSSFNQKTLKLVVSNGICVDSATKIFTPLDHTIKAGFIMPNDTICPTQLIRFTDSSKGIITSWKWLFGNGDSSLLSNPVAKSFPFFPTLKKYSILLIVKNIVGCVDSTSKTLAVEQGVASIIDSVVPLLCSPNYVELHFSNKLLCNTISHDGSNFSISGSSNVLIDSASIVCINGEVSNVKLAFASPINNTGEYLVKVKKANDNSQLNNVCNIITPVGTSKKFDAYGAVSALFTNELNYGCKMTTISYKSGNANGINKWLWTFSDSTTTYTSTKVDTTITYTDLSDKKVSLVVSNPVCTDIQSKTIQFKNYNDTVKAGFVIQKNDVGTIEQTYFICPTEKAIYKDTSIGIINSWLWDFGNGISANSEMPSPQSYQAFGRMAKDYPVKLIVKGNYCNDTTINYIKVVPNCYIDVPSAFSPNGDNNNDYLYPLDGYKADNLLFRVFDRYGHLVFETRDWNIKWDGKIKGADPIVGTYVWTLTYTDHDTKLPVTKQGTSVLIK